MPPRATMNPAPKTESARLAAKNFFCELCNKGYLRQNEYETHLDSLDHQHIKRNKEAKAAQRANFPQQRSKPENTGLTKIELGNSASSAGKGFKKGGFKSAFEEVGDTNSDGKDAEVKQDNSSKGTGDPRDTGDWFRPTTTIVPSESIDIDMPNAPVTAASHANGHDDPRDSWDSDIDTYKRCLPADYEDEYLEKLYGPD